MDNTPPVRQGRQLIQSYGDGGFRIAGQRHAGAILVLTGETRSLAITSLQDLTLAHLAPLRDTSPMVEFMLVGSGGAMATLDKELRLQIREWGIVCDVMVTGAACRTLNVLLSEGRPVAAVLLPVD